MNDEWADECRSEYDSDDSDDSNAENHPDDDFPEEQDSDLDDDIFGGMGMRMEAATHGESGRGDHGVGGDDSEYDVDEYVEESDSEYDSGVDEYGKHSDSEYDVDGHDDDND